MLRLVVAAAAMVAGIGSAAPGALAQGLSPYGMWGEEQRYGRRVPPPPPPSMYDDDEYEPRPGFRQGYRYERERARAYDRRGYAAPPFGYGGYGFDDDGYYDEPPRGYGRFDAPEDEAADGPVADGGARPTIIAKAPPKVAFYGTYVSGAIVIDVGARRLYYVNGDATAYAYPIGVGRQGFGWTGAEKVSRVAAWPDWHPPKEMRQREPHLPAKMTGGLSNPLGAHAIYLGQTLYRIHGTNDPKSIGRAASSGCFRMMNEHVAHLAGLVQVGADVHVVQSLGADVANSGAKAVR